MVNKSLSIVKNPRLTRGQTELYSIICGKIKDNDKLKFEEARRIYIGFVNRNMINGIPHSYQYDWESKQFKLLPMTDDYLNFVVLTWLTQNLGALILKGYLTVLPAVDLNLLK